MTRNSYLLAGFSTLVLVCSLRADPGPLSLYFNYPGVPGFETTIGLTGNKSWYNNGLPIGNGKLAAMVVGGVANEMIQFNEDTIWSGQPHNYANPDSTLAHLQSIQNKCFNGTDILSEADDYLLATPSRLPEYQCAGGLRLIFPHPSSTGYFRSLNLSNATVNVTYTNAGIRYNREIFASTPSNRVIVVRLTSSQSSSIAFTCALTNLQTGTYSTVSYGGGVADVVMHASVFSKGDSRYFTTPNLGLTNAVKYDARVRLIATGGTVTNGSGSISVTNADSVTLFLSAVSNVKGYNDVTQDYVTICSNNVAGAAALGYNSVRQTQQDDYTSLFNRVVLDLGNNPFKSASTNDLGNRKKVMATDPTDWNLVTLFFQLGRYLVISGSRPGSEPLTLTGKWNDTTNGFNFWGSKMTLNINQEMNYSGTEVANLSECTEPLFDLIKDLSESGHKVALSNYFCTSTNAWVAHHNTDLWRNAGPVNGWDGYWTAGGAWLCQHLWWHYQYTGDTNWLATTGYPLMKGAAQFFKEFLIPIPPTSIYYNTTSANWLVTCPSMSPEHADPAAHSNYPGPTMDNDIIRELFKNVIAASEILNDDPVFRTNIMVIRSKLPPDTVGSFGQLREFLNYEDDDPGHRHCSGLVGLSPGEEISPFYTPVIARAARVSVDYKGDPTTDTPWSRAVRLTMHTRLHDGEGAFVSLNNILGGSKVSTNLMFGDGGGEKRQVDFILGSLSGIAEMFLQSHAGDVHLLPAVPSRFTNGVVSGLCARGGFQVDNMSWTNGRLTGATILSKLGNTCRLRSKWPIDVKLGSDYVSAPMISPGLYQFSTTAGNNYTIIPALIAETENLSPTTSGDTHTVLTNAAFSNWRGTLFNANATSDFVSYVVSNVVAGDYHVRVYANANTNRGQFQLSVGPVGGSLADVGSVQDTYAATNLAYLLPIRLSGTTNAINLWTNQLTEYDCGTWTAPANSNYVFKFTVAGKNAGSSGYALSFDFIKLTPELNVAPNNAPTDIALANTNVLENQSAATTVGALSTTDPDSGNTFTYTLVSGAGSTDNGSFSITGSNLQTSASFDYETQNSYSIRVRTTDQGSLFTEKAFIISVVDSNDVPTDISISTNTVAENEPSSTTIGTFTSTDVDSATFTYTLVSGAGSTDNGSFAIVGDTLQTATNFDYEAQNSYSIRVRTTDDGSPPLSYEEVFIVNATDVNESPATPANLTPSNGAADQSLTLTLQTSTFNDPDSGDAHAASQWLIRRVSDSALVFDSGEDLANKTNLTLLSGTLDFGTSYSWQTRHEDGQGLWSDYSTLAMFTTLAPTLTATAQDGLLLLLWPTNTTDFSLEYTTNDLPATSWDAASPGPVIVDGFNFVTNTVESDKKFYRLHKP